MENVKFTVSTKNSDGTTAKEFEISKQFGATIEESISEFGADVVHSHFIRSAVIQLQAALRTKMSPDKDGDIEVKTAAAAQKFADGYEIKVKERIDPVQKAQALVAKLSDADLKALGLTRSK